MHTKYLALAAVLMVGTACKEPLGAKNQDLVLAGTAQPLQNLVTGVTAQDRIQATRFAYLLYPEGEARNVLRADPNEPRFISELIGVPIDPSDFIGGSGWTEGYQTIRAVNELIVSPVLNAPLSAADKAATIGFVQTIKARAYLRIVQLRDSLGAPIQGPNRNVVDPMRTSAAVLKYVSAVLDSGYASLSAAGPSVPFNVPSGFTLHGDYSQTANLKRLNRGLKGIAETYRGFARPNACGTPCFTTAIAAFNEALAGVSAVPTASELAEGPYYQFNPSAPESFANPLVDNHIYLTDNFANSIAAGDARSSKIVTAPNASATPGGLSKSLTRIDPVTDPGNKANLTRPIPMVRNAVFFLLRAQAEVETGDLVSATRDINAVHVGEGGLQPLLPFTSADAARQQILYEMRYSLVLEGPWYLVALRQYGALTTAYVTQPGMPSLRSDPSHRSDPLQTTLPIPANEAAARNGNITPQP